MKMLFLRLFLFAFVGCFFTACATVQLNPGAEKIIISSSPLPACLKIKKVIISDPALTATISEKITEFSISIAKNEAFEVGADHAVLTIAQSRPIGSSQVIAEYVACNPISELSDETLELLCQNNQANACLAMANRAQLRNNYAEMLDFFRRGCKLSDNPSCDWLEKFELQKSKLKKLCIKKDGQSCFAAGKVADVEQDFSLMMTYLHHGCSYGHSESCFYETYSQQEKLRIQEEIERIKDYRTRRYQEYMVKLQEESLRQQQIISTMAILNRKTSTNCISRKNFDGTVYTQCN